MELLKECLRVFGVKQNPVVDFWFIPTQHVLERTAEFPKDFTDYKLYKKDYVFGVEWSCYIKKAVKGCFSDRYWKANV